MLYYFHSILHVTEFPDTLSYVARTMSDKRSFEQLFCHLLKVLCIQETFASSLSLSTPTLHLLIFSWDFFWFHQLYSSPILNSEFWPTVGNQLVTKYRIPLHGTKSQSWSLNLENIKIWFVLSTNIGLKRTIYCVGRKKLLSSKRDIESKWLTFLWPLASFLSMWLSLKVIAFAFDISSSRSILLHLWPPKLALNPPLYMNVESPLPGETKRLSSSSSSRLGSRSCDLASK